MTVARTVAIGSHSRGILWKSVKQAVRVKVTSIWVNNKTLQRTHPMTICHGIYYVNDRGGDRDHIVVFRGSARLTMETISILE